jgi:hypothetical protein
MRPAPPDTYGIRADKYERRAQMAVWVAAGIAALVAFIGARALDRAPGVLTALVFTIVVAAGFFLAFARVGFEWRATEIKRGIKTDPALERAPLDAEDQPWPAVPEFFWTACLILIGVGWVIMLVGIWWPRPPTVVPAIVTRTELQTVPIGRIGPFADCSADLPLDYENQINLLVRNYRDRVNANVRAALIILVGSADNRRLTRRCSVRFGTNEQLAIARANIVRMQLEQELSQERLQPSYAVLASGPRHLEATTEGGGRRQDRSVEVWVAIDSSQASAVQPGRNVRWAQANLGIYAKHGPSEMDRATDFGPFSTRSIGRGQTLLRYLIAPG